MRRSASRAAAVDADRRTWSHLIPGWVYDKQRWELLVSGEPFTRELCQNRGRRVDTLTASPKAVQFWAYIPGEILILHLEAGVQHTVMEPGRSM